MTTNNLIIKVVRGTNKVIVRYLPASLLGVNYSNQYVEKLGSGEGAWSVPIGILDANSICYCVGVGRDISFDLALQKKYNCYVFSFDPTPSSINYIASLGDIPIFFKPWGCWNEDKKLSLYPQSEDSTVNLSVINSYRGNQVCEVECFRLQTIMNNLGHSNIDLLKIDIEGCWMEIIKDMKRSGIIPRIFCVEFDSPTSFLKVRRAIFILKSMGLLFINRCRDNYIFMQHSEINK